MKIRNIFLAVFFIVAAQISVAQEKSNTDRIAILPYVSDQVEYLPSIAKNNLQSKLAQIVSQNGFGSSTGYTNRFIITPNVSVLNKYVVSGAPTKISLELEVAIFVGDGVTGVKYASTSLNVKGVGLNEAKAYMSAVKSIRPKNRRIVQLLEEAKRKIIDFYSDCDLVMNDINMYVSTEQYDEALLLANSVPQISRKCYDLAYKQIRPIYRKKIDYDCKILLSQAEAAWNVGQNLESAQNAGAYLTKISPSSACYGKVQAFYNKVSKVVNRNQDRAWDFVLKQQENFNNYKNQEIDAWRKISLEAVKNQPQQVFRTNGWW
tara:strand:+ start:749 stop:1708 length:960 start_codon:yes stop_codon:yes gene_type:complete